MTRGSTISWKSLTRINIATKLCQLGKTLCSFRNWVKFQCKFAISWWRHEMETFSALLVICAVNSSVPGKFPAQRPVTRSFDVFFDLRLNKRLSKQSWGWWFETLSSPLWRHCNVTSTGITVIKLRWSEDCLIFIMENSYLKRWSLYQGWSLWSEKCQ